MHYYIQQNADSNLVCRETKGAIRFLDHDVAAITRAGKLKGAERRVDTRVKVG